MEAIEKLRETVGLGEDYAVGAAKARIAIIALVFWGFILCGITEHTTTLALSRPLSHPANASENATTARRYCDPPNITALVIYYDSSEEGRDYDSDAEYEYFSQLEEMHFETELTHEEYMEIMLRKSYLWGTLVSPIAAAQLVGNIGAKRVFGYSLLGSAATTMLVPAAWLTPSHVIIRFVQGVFNGALVPSAHTLAVSWFPPMFRSSFVSWYSGKYIGFATAETLTGIAVESIGRDYIFHATGLLTIVWFVFWSVLVYNKPEKSRNLSPEATRQIMLEVGKQQSSKTRDIPWKYMLCSRPVWMSIGAIFGSHCGQSATNFGMRQYLKFVYRVSESVTSAVPFLIHAGVALACGYTVDVIHKTRFVSVTSSRRMFVYISHFLPAGFIFVVSFVGCNVTAPITLYSMSIITSGAIYSGALSSPLDISPNFAAIIIGLCCTFGAVGDLITVYLVAQILDGEVTGSWRITFSMTSLILVVTSILFMLRGSGSVQFWNDPSGKSEAVGGRRSTESSLQPPGVASPPPKVKYSVEEKILKVLHVQEPERFTRVRAYSTSLPNESAKIMPRTHHLRLDKKRASIS